MLFNCGLDYQLSSLFFSLSFIVALKQLWEYRLTVSHNKLL